MDVISFFIELAVMIGIAMVTWWAVPSHVPRGMASLQWATTHKKVRRTLVQWTASETFDRELYAAGWTWFNATRWFVFRLTFILLAFSYALYQYTAAHAVFYFFAVVLVWWITRPKLPSPLLVVLDYFKRRRAYEVNREVYLLYHLIIQDFELDATGGAKNLYQSIKRILAFLHYIKVPIQQMLLRWDDDPVRAIQLFGESMATEEGEFLAKVLMDVERSSPATALDLLKNRFVTFQNKRIKEKKSLRQVRSAMEFAVLGLVMTTIGINALMVLTNYVTSTMTGNFIHS